MNRLIKSKRRIDAVGLALTILGAGAAWFALAAPLRASWASTAQREAELGALAAQATQMEAETHALELRVADSDKLAAQSSLQARPVSDLNSRIAELIRTADASGLTPSGVRPGSPVPDGGAVRVGIDINGAGSFPALTGFLNHLHSEDRDITLTRIHVSRDRAATTFDLGLVWWASDDATPVGAEDASR